MFSSQLPSRSGQIFLYQNRPSPATQERVFCLTLFLEGGKAMKKITRREANEQLAHPLLRALGVIGVGMVVASCRNGQSPTAPTPPPSTPPANPGVPQYELRHPKTIAFSFDKSQAQRIGEVRFAGSPGTLKEVMDAARLANVMRNDGLVTSFESVRPTGTHGLVFLVRGERFVSEVSSKNVQLATRDDWAVYEWMGANSAAQANRVYMFIGE
jgi:hypothetical protein